MALRARIEVVLSAVLAVAAILTAALPGWIETVSGFDPDGGNGSAERLVVVALAVAAIVAAAVARRDLRAARIRGLPRGYPAQPPAG